VILIRVPAPKERRSRAQPPSTPSEVASARADSARERILHTAYALFATNGIRAVGVDRIIAEAGVAKLTLYRHFPSKQALVEAVLELRQELWTFGWIFDEIARRSPTPEGQLLAIFDVFDEWFRRDDYEACVFISTLFETHDRTSELGAAAVTHLVEIRDHVARLGREAGVRDPDAFAAGWQIIMAGAIVQAAQGNAEAARVAKPIAARALEDSKR
jgi:AcrR family transcriptional regulator